MRVKICGIRSAADAAMCVGAGASALGFLCAVPSSVRCYVAPEVAREIIATVPPYVATVMVTTMTAPAEIQDLLFRVPASTLQLHGSIALESVAALRSRNPHLKFVRAIPVTGRESIAVALRWHSCVDALLLDTQGHGDQGGTGRIHDWNLSREIIQTVTGPVILAGGLSPENVEEAVRATGPFAVDANSGVTNELLLKDPRKVAEFIRRALKGA